MRPPHRHTARRSTTGHTMRSSRTALHPRCRHEPRGCDLNSVNETEITPHEAVFDGEGNRLLPSAGPGEGVRPRDTARGVGRPRLRTRLSAGDQRYGVVNEPCSGPVGPCCSVLLSIDKYKPEMARGQRLFGPRNWFVTSEVCYACVFGLGMTPPLSLLRRQGRCSQALRSGSRSARASFE